MSYCTIEEAWGEQISKPTNPTKSRILDADDYDRVTIPSKRRSKHKKRNYKHSNIYDESQYYGDNSNINSNTQPYNLKNNFSRGVTRLPNHNGPPTRSMLQDIHNADSTKDYMGYSSTDVLNYESINNSPAQSYSKIHNDIYECPDKDELYNTDGESDGEEHSLESFDNLSTLLNQSDKSISQNPQNPQNHQNNKHDSEFKIDNDFNKTNIHNNYNNNNYNNNNIYDLVLYMFTGVFYLVLCDFIYKLGKKTY
jgi:hypothetical protein